MPLAHTRPPRHCPHTERALPRHPPRHDGRYHGVRSGRHRAARVIAPSLLLLLAALLGGCATTPPLNTRGVNPELSPQSALAQAQALQGQRVLWGGMIISASNFPHHTQLEVLGFPLDGNQQPDTARKPQTRFLIEKSGYLETVDYAQGRLVTVVGTLSGTRQGEIGQSHYTYPVVKADQLRLWPVGGNREPRTRFNFGLGVIFH